MSRKTNIPLKTKAASLLTAVSLTGLTIHNSRQGIECDVPMDGTISNTQAEIQAGGGDSDAAVLVDSNHQTVDPTSRPPTWDGVPTVYDEAHNPGQGDFLRVSAPNAKVCQDIGEIVVKTSNQ
jgi:hypothetical protein